MRFFKPTLHSPFNFFSVPTSLINVLFFVVVVAGSTLQQCKCYIIIIIIIIINNVFFVVFLCLVAERFMPVHSKHLIEDCW